MSAANHKRPKRATSATVEVNRDAVLALLSTAYRSRWQLGQMCAEGLTEQAEETFSIERSWLRECLRYMKAEALDNEGTEALLEAAQLLGVEKKDAFSRFISDHEAEVEITDAVADAVMRKINEKRA